MVMFPEEITLFSQIIESSDDSIDFGEALMFYDAAKYLDSLIEGEEESK